MYMSKIQNFAPAKMGIAAKTMSLAFVITILVMDYFFLDVSRPFQSWLSALLFLGPVALLTIVWFRRVKSYSLMENKIIVQMGSYTREYDIDQIQEIKKPHILFMKLRKIYGNGGLFSYTGLYSYPKIGRFKAFVTNWDHCIILKMRDEQIALSPENYESFLDQIAGQK